jgi:hypothetical protein
VRETTGDERARITTTVKAYIELQEQYRTS